jgi:hypothetical protein
MTRNILSRIALGKNAPVRHLMKIEYLRRMVSENVSGNGFELFGGIVDSAMEFEKTPLVINGSVSLVPDIRSEIFFRNFDFKSPVTFSDSWGMLSFHDSEFADFHFNGKSAELFFGNKTRATSVSVNNSVINGFFLYFSHISGDVVISDSFVRLVFLKKSVIDGDLDLSSVRGLNHLSLCETEVKGLVIAPSDPHLSHHFRGLQRIFGDRVVLGKHRK